MKNYLDISRDVEQALDERKPVVALESAIIAHGVPYPKNVETAVEVQDTLRSMDVVPATIGIIKGRIKVGLTKEDIIYLAQSNQAIKVSRRDFPYVSASCLDGTTTVAGAMIAAEAAGIRILVTGGIGGVHRGAAESFDISADLEELKRTNTVVVCGGVKSILDIGATLEYLETSGVPVLTYGSDWFPAFYSKSSGFPADCRVDDIEIIAKIIIDKYGMGLKGGMLIACPIAPEEEIPFKEMESVIEKALAECREIGITGKRITPYLLGKIKGLTEGKSVGADISLVVDNAKIGGRIALKLSSLV